MQAYVTYSDEVRISVAAMGEVRGSNWFPRNFITQDFCLVYKADDIYDRLGQFYFKAVTGEFAWASPTKSLSAKLEIKNIEYSRPVEEGVLPQIIRGDNILIEGWMDCTFNYHLHGAAVMPETRHFLTRVALNIEAL